MTTTTPTLSRLLALLALPALVSIGAGCTGDDDDDDGGHHHDPAVVVFSTDELVEDGTNQGDVGTVVGITLLAGEFETASGTLTEGTDYLFTGTPIPAGLTASVQVTSATAASLSLTGQAAEHQDEDSATGVVFSLEAPAFHGGAAAEDGSDTIPLAITFQDNSIVLYSTGMLNADRGGRAGVDGDCEAVKPVTVTQANVRAFISTSEADEIRDMPASYSVPTNQMVVSTSGMSVATDWADLTDGTLGTTLQSAGIGLEHVEWWSGTAADGSLGLNCSGFTSADMIDNGQTGLTASTTDVIAGGGGDPCMAPKHVLCIAFD